MGSLCVFMLKNPALNINGENVMLWCPIFQWIFGKICLANLLPHTELTQTLSATCVRWECLVDTQIRTDLCQFSTFPK